MMTPIDIPMNDLRAQIAPIRAELEAAIAGVIDSTAFALGPAAERFERAFASYVGVRHCIGVSSGTAALHVALLAAGVGGRPLGDDEVITVPATFFATAEAISHCGARPVFVDVEDETYTLNPALLERAIT